MIPRYLLTFVLTCSLLLLSVSAEAGTDLPSGSIADSLCGIVVIMLGPVGKGIATLSIVFVVTTIFTGKIDQWQAITIGACIAAMFGSIQVVSWTTGFVACQPPAEVPTPEIPIDPRIPVGNEYCPQAGAVRDDVSCPEGFFGTTMSQVCINNQWVVHQSDCQLITCDNGAVPGSPPEEVPCPPGKVGTMLRTCVATGVDAEGKWVTTVDTSCTPAPVTCQTSNDATPRLTEEAQNQQHDVNTTITAHCPTDAQKTITYTCGSDGSWSTNNHTCPTVCQPGQTMPGKCLATYWGSKSFCEIEASKPNDPYSCRILSTSGGIGNHGSTEITFIQKRCASDGLGWIDLPPPTSRWLFGGCNIILPDDDD